MENLPQNNDLLKCNCDPSEKNIYHESPFTHCHQILKFYIQ